MGLDPRKPVFRDLWTTKAQSSLRSLISASIIHVFKSIISKLAMSEILIFQLVSAAEQAGLNITISETLMTGFLTARPK